MDGKQTNKKGAEGSWDRKPSRFFFYLLVKGFSADLLSALRGAAC
jgi:hypothetical protein